MQDGKFLVEFYTCHPADKRYNAVNQRYWLEYHPKSQIADPFRNRTAHLVRPSSQSESYATAEGLEPFRQWVRLIHAETYITGPFDFSSINGRKSRDRVGHKQWRILSKLSHLFTNSVPPLDLPNYSVHCGQYHVTLTTQPITARVAAYEAHPSSPATV